MKTENKEKIQWFQSLDKLIESCKETPHNMVPLLYPLEKSHVNEEKRQIGGELACAYPVIQICGKITDCVWYGKKFESITSKHLYLSNHYQVTSKNMESMSGYKSIIKLLNEWNKLPLIEQKVYDNSKTIELTQTDSHNLMWVLEHVHLQLMLMRKDISNKDFRKLQHFTLC